MRTLVLRDVRQVQVEMVREGGRGKPAITGPENAVVLARAILPTDREGFAVIHCDGRRQPLSVELVAVGIINACIVHPREVFKGAILANAASIIVAHNHPSGDPLPTDEDFNITHRLVRVGSDLGIEVTDSLVVTAEAFHSMREHREGGLA